ncbi:hypothetical protein chiPu_0001631 [Chiloscyllium punctatum]|uniref:Uncharacterized protein n=1 Tax=Chiloscyllium punctatum TaxID=137246 RepID=A0A401RYK4_CHIPU|nr:hypothetical protein [Chiloscyllium punctatum]
MSWYPEGIGRERWAEGRDTARAPEVDRSRRYWPVSDRGQGEVPAALGGGGVCVSAGGGPWYRPLSGSVARAGQSLTSRGVEGREGAAVRQGASGWWQQR